MLRISRRLLPETVDHITLNDHQFSTQIFVLRKTTVLSFLGRCLALLIASPGLALSGFLAWWQATIGERRGLSATIGRSLFKGTLDSDTATWIVRAGPRRGNRWFVTFAERVATDWRLTIQRALRPMLWPSESRVNCVAVVLQGLWLLCLEHFPQGLERVRTHTSHFLLWLLGLILRQQVALADLAATDFHVGRVLRVNVLCVLGAAAKVVNTAVNVILMLVVGLELAEGGGEGRSLAGDCHCDWLHLCFDTVWWPAKGVGATTASWLGQVHTLRHQVVLLINSIDNGWQPLNTVTMLATAVRNVAFLEFRLALRLEDVHVLVLLAQKMLVHLLLWGVCVIELRFLKNLTRVRQLRLVHCLLYRSLLRHLVRLLLLSNLLLNRCAASRCTSAAEWADWERLLHVGRCSSRVTLTATTLV